MHSPMKNQQATSVTTTVFTATSFIEACNQIFLDLSILYASECSHHLSPFECEGISSQLTDTFDGANQITRAGGDELDLGVLGKGGQVLKNEFLPDTGKLQQSHYNGEWGCLKL